MEPIPTEREKIMAGELLMLASEIDELRRLLAMNHNLPAIENYKMYAMFCRIHCIKDTSGRYILADIIKYRP